MRLEEEVETEEGGGRCEDGRRVEREAEREKERDAERDAEREAARE